MSPAAPSLDPGDGAPLGAEARAVEAFKKVTLLGLGAAMQRFGAKLQDEQEVLLWLADLAIDTYAAESAVLRAQAAAGVGRMRHRTKTPRARSSATPPCGSR